MNKEKLLARIKAKMIEKQIKLGELSQKTGIKYGTLAHILGGRSKLSIEHIFKIAEALGVEPWELLAPEGVSIRTEGIAVGVGVGNHVGDVNISQDKIESKTEEGQKWERLFKDCQAKLKKCIEKRKELESLVKELEAENLKLKGQVELLQRLLEQKEKTILTLMSKK